MSGIALPYIHECEDIWPPPGSPPSVHFRQVNRTCNVLWVDGHVEAWADAVRTSLPPDAEPYRDFFDRNNLFDIGATDELWDAD